MTPNRRVAVRPYSFELFVAANFLVVLIFASRTRPLIGSLPRALSSFTLYFLVCGAIGVAVRSVVAAVRRDRSYFRVIRSAGWLCDTLRIAVFCGLGSFSYSWIKVVVPIYHPRLFDQAIWDLEQLIFGGVSPNVLLLELFSHPMALRAVDWTYATVFTASLFVAMAFFVSHASRRVRVAFATGNMFMWLTGAWLYLLIPSLGPAYRFPEIWFAHTENLGRTQFLQATLMRNYQNLLRLWSGQPAGPVRVLFGIGAFPSLHVAFQTLVFLWMRRLWVSGELLFGIFVVIIFLGSVITGWHYLLDSVAGLALAGLAFGGSMRLFRMKRWLRLRGN